jgi:hypothetical protein
LDSIAPERTHGYDEPYARLLLNFCATEDTSNLADEVKAVSTDFISASVSPMEIKAIHDYAVSQTDWGRR